MRDGPTLALSLQRVSDTKCLIALLSHNAKPIKFKSPFPRLAIGLCVGACLTGLGGSAFSVGDVSILKSIAQRPDYAIHALVVATLAVLALGESCRPGGERTAMLLSAACVVTMAASLWTLWYSGPFSRWADLDRCIELPKAVGWRAAASVLPFIVLIAAAREWAPTRPLMTSAIAALAASAAASPIAAFFTPSALIDGVAGQLAEIVIFVVAGSFAGQRLLRW